ncbi:hypothetical protein [Haloarcula laminariae]|nr:hypothetical protein [Halomicroarcula laminariae]
MPVLERLTNTLGRSKSYVCRFCRLTFDRERRNCPACGCGPIEPDR